MGKKLLLPDEVVMSKIYLVRGQKVMLDIDLAELYQVTTSRLNEQVKRNTERFPEDFMFQLTNSEWDSLRSPIAISKNGKGGRRYAPFVFTEYGVLMLSSVLHSDLAILVNIQIMRIYAKLRQALLTNKDILLKLEQLERKAVKQDDDIKLIFGYLRELLDPKPESMRKIGFKQKGK